MSSAYKALSKSGESTNLDIDDELSDQSSNTIQGDSTSMSDSESTSGSESSRVAALPVELRNRVLMLTSRGVSHRHRHLLSDLHSLLPHTHKDTKLDTKSSNNYNAALNALADLHSCNYVFFLEARKHGQDLYLWLAKAPNGPTMKFSVTNVHTMGELGFGGNCLKGGRGLVVFDKSFDEQVAGSECRLLMREMLSSVFCVPSKGVRGMKPFIDRIVGVYGLDGKIWIRVYEIRETEKPTEPSLKGTDVSLVEIGPRFVLTPVVVLEGSFGGPVIFENKEFVSPNQVRSIARHRKSEFHERRRKATNDLKLKRQTIASQEKSKKSAKVIDNDVLFA